MKHYDVQHVSCQHKANVQGTLQNTDSTRIEKVPLGQIAASCRESRKSLLGAMMAITCTAGTRQCPTTISLDSVSNSVPCVHELESMNETERMHGVWDACSPVSHTWGSSSKPRCVAKKPLRSTASNPSAAQVGETQHLQ